jgi:hypothetical protein
VISSDQIQLYSLEDRSSAEGRILAGATRSRRHDVVEVLSFVGEFVLSGGRSCKFLGEDNRLQLLG